MVRLHSNTHLHDLNTHVNIHLKVNTASLSLPVSISCWLRACRATLFFCVWIHITWKFCNVNKQFKISCIRSMYLSQTSHTLSCCSVFLLFLSDTQNVLHFILPKGENKISILMTFNFTQYITMHSKSVQTLSVCFYCFIPR